MAFDCYCAICGVGFSGMRIGTPSDATAERRRQYVDRISRSLNGTTTADLECRDGEEPIHSYDPSLVDQDNIAWTSQVHCLGMQDDTKGKSRAFLSGPGYYADAGELAVKVGQTARRTYFNCYGFGTDEVPGPVMPFHWCCFEVLLRALTGTTDPKNVNLEALYEAMSSLCNWSGSALRVQYGDDVVRAQGQYWQSLPGAEYTVRHPSTTAISETITANLQTNKKLRAPPAEINLGTRQPKNPFSTLPTELVHQICSLLPGESLKSLTQASLFINLITRDDYFWKRVIATDMPWLEAPESEALRKVVDLDSSSRETPLNYQLVYQWLDEVSKPKFGMDDPVLMAVANRRRIWGVCEEVARAYRSHFT
ncbi:hypothetical protein BJY01DRAFT_100746 [Aspergillus pseudoustus]|uniref:F-box domain-containing protein n=1 Tax=Aspergillus pseudoustus TaxID=1810923 RepID=A0ABR4KIM4_9EURO